MTSQTIPLRTWATPLTIGAFFLIAATGVLMFLEWERGLMTVVHQWFSWVFLAGAVGHIAANVRPLKAHLRSYWGRASVAVFLAVLVASFFSWGLITGPQLVRPIEQALVEAPLSALASVTRTDPEALMQRLKAYHIKAHGGQSIRELSGTYGVGEDRLLAIVFVPD